MILLRGWDGGPEQRILRVTVRKAHRQHVMGVSPSAGGCFYAEHEGFFVHRQELRPDAARYRFAHLFGREGELSGSAGRAEDDDVERADVPRFERERRAFKEERVGVEPLHRREVFPAEVRALAERDVGRDYLVRVDDALRRAFELRNHTHRLGGLEGEQHVAVARRDYRRCLARVYAQVARN